MSHKDRIKIYMLLIPAVDIKSGRAVRLKQGLADQETVYDTDPVHAARRWADAGARRIHIVDLDGAFDGTPKNRAIILQIIAALASTLELEIGGGLRVEETITELLDAGAARCVIGTRALEDRVFLKRLTDCYPGRINLGLDAKDGKVVTRGWVQASDIVAADFVRSLNDLRLGEVIYTDVSRDGMLEGPNFQQLHEILRASPFPLIASGGVTTIEQIRQCRDMGCFGAIIGKALYDGRLDLKMALETT
ncbi:MAG: 1-(5-phosphoribosyl)-5-[(5-phosphoribosylamino)methylideneamino]imidazole-4-carboxamide isomerase [Planctomycetota bacterium]